MKKNHLFLIIFCLVLSFPTILNKAVAVTETILYVDPAIVKDIPIGGNFTINVSVADVEALYTWQTILLFNSTVLSCTEAAYPTTGGIFNGKPIIPVTPEIDNSLGFVLFGASLMGLDSASGSGVLCQITFQVLTIGESDLEFSSPYGEDTFLLDDELETISVTIQKGFFTNLPTPFHDVAVTELSLSTKYPKQNDSVSVEVKVLNNGTVSESFNVSLFYDSNLIEMQTVTSLAPAQNATLTFDWNTTGVPLGSYIMKAEAAIVSGETEVANNVKTETVTVISPTALSTDLNGDGVVDMKDIGRAAKAFGSYPDHPRWDPAADIDGDGEVTLIDIALIARDFGKKSA
jgi:hypothetical protein